MKSKRAESRARYFVREQAQKRGWNVNHISSGGSCLEEQEITEYFKNIGLGLERPDFLFCISTIPMLVIETKNQAAKIETAIQEAIYYCEKINKTKKYNIKIAIGVAGEEDTGYVIEVRFLRNNSWIPLKSKGFEITTIPTKNEIEAALEANDGTTNVQVPSVTEFIDFLGLLYEAFLRYGYDNNALGIVFTPRHITRFCVELVDASITDMVIDIACGTGGFLVSAFDRMFNQAHGPKAIMKVKASLYGFDTNPTIWALSTLNMFFRGDGKSNIENKSCFDKDSIQSINQKFTRAFLNPPFSQENEPERDFVNASMSALMPEGIFVSIIWAGIFADDDNANWRKEFTRNHTLLGMISMPDDLFYPTAATTTIMIAKAHVPQQPGEKVFMARIWNDGYEKLKGRRIS